MCQDGVVAWVSHPGCCLCVVWVRSRAICVWLRNNNTTTSYVGNNKVVASDWHNVHVFAATMSLKSFKLFKCWKYMYRVWYKDSWRVSCYHNAYICESFIQKVHSRAYQILYVEDLNGNSTEATGFAQLSVLWKSDLCFGCSLLKNVSQLLK